MSKTKLPMHEPCESDGRIRNPNMVGMIYETTKLGSIHMDERVIVGDILLCLDHSGDCFYTWALLEKTVDTQEVQYYKISNIYDAYAVSGFLLVEEPLTEKEMKSALIYYSKDKNGSVLHIKKADEIETTPCILCGHIKDKIE